MRGGGQDVGIGVSPPAFSLADLLAAVTDETIHADVDFGPPIGKERL